MTARESHISSLAGPASFPDALNRRDRATSPIPEEDEARIREAIQRGKGKAKTRPLGVWRAQLTEAIVELAKAHQGIGIVSSRQISPCTADRHLSVLPVGPSDRRVYWAAWRKSNPRRLPLSELVNTIRGVWELRRDRMQR